MGLNWFLPVSLGKIGETSRSGLSSQQLLQATGGVTTGGVWGVRITAGQYAVGMVPHPRQALKEPERDGRAGWGYLISEAYAPCRVSFLFSFFEIYCRLFSVA